MAQIYANLIRKGIKTIDDVPASIKPDVEALLTRP
ncbi:CD1375 family protein [Paenibacillus contaminans]|nr:CD1375 family protein [Paenibacillus contaminans]